MLQRLTHMFDLNVDYREMIMKDTATEVSHVYVYQETFTLHLKFISSLIISFVIYLYYRSNRFIKRYDLLYPSSVWLTVLAGHVEFPWNNYWSH